MGWPQNSRTKQAKTLRSWASNQELVLGGCHKTVRIRTYNKQVKVKFSNQTLNLGFASTKPPVACYCFSECIPRNDLAKYSDFFVEVQLLLSLVSSCVFPDLPTRRLAKDSNCTLFQGSTGNYHHSPPARSTNDFHCPVSLSSVKGCHHPQSPRLIKALHYHQSLKFALECHRPHSLKLAKEFQYPRNLKSAKELYHPPSLKVLKDCHRTQSQYSGSPMGTSCSSNLHSGGHKPNSDGLADCFSSPNPRRRTQSDPTFYQGHINSAVCKCQSRNHENGRVDNPQGFHANSSQANTPDHHTATTTPNSQTNNREPLNTASSASGKLSKIFGQTKARATSNCDVSPHRLLTRRTHFPPYRTSSLDYRHVNGPPTLLWHRSHSWTNGKYGIYDHLKASAVNQRPPALPSGRVSRCNGPQTTPRSSPGPCSPTLNNSVKAFKGLTHDTNCPLYVRPQDGTHSSKSYEHELHNHLQDDLTPMSRPRAASESHTTRPHRHVLRTCDSSDLTHSNDHAHVHWADEGEGSSLSTSVTLSSLRPRSYSHGAADSPTPHRPILKKVAVL